MNVEIGYKLIITTELGKTEAYIKDILDSYIIKINPIITGKNLTDIYSIYLNHLKFIRISTVEVFGILLFFDGIIEKGDFVIVGREEEEEEEDNDIKIEF